VSHKDRELEAERLGRESAESGGSWTDNPYDHHTVEWFAFEDARQEHSERGSK
jgi:hypothetical protein